MPRTMVLTSDETPGTIAAKGRATVVVRAAGRVEDQRALHPSMKGVLVAEGNREPSVTCVA